MKRLTFHDGVSGLSSPDTQGLEHLLESVLGLVLGREDEGGGLPAAVTHPDGGQDLLEEGTPGGDLQSGGGGDQSGPPVDVDVVECRHDWTESTFGCEIHYDELPRLYILEHLLQFRSERRGLKR